MARKRKMTRREANGRPQRAEARERDPRLIAMLARQRVFGVSAEQSRSDLSATVVGRLRLTDEINRDQFEAAVRYLDARYAMLTAIDAPGRLRSSGPISDDDDAYEDRCHRARRRWVEISTELDGLQYLMHSRAPRQALRTIVEDDRPAPHLIGDLRLALNAIHHVFSSTRRKRLLTAAE